jgi:hypothetical protein
MNKTNNLRAYLRDLYEGIVSKKPDASRNPQNFRSEIEAIRTGGELYEVMDASELPEDAPNGSLALVEGEPIPEAYTVSSVDELPSDAVDGSLAVVNKHTEDWVTKTWNGLELPYPIINHIWTDGTNTYYSRDETQKVLNGDTWEDKVWTGLTSFSGDCIWKFNGTVYYSNGTEQYVLSGDNWEAKTWSNLAVFYGDSLFTTNNYACVVRTDNLYILYGESSSWSVVSNSITNLEVGCIWTDGANTYYSNGTEHYKLTGVGEWETKTWSGLTEFYGYEIFTHNGSCMIHQNKYSYNGQVIGCALYVLNGDIWEERECVWTNPPDASDIWACNGVLYGSGWRGQFVLAEIVKQQFYTHENGQWVYKCEVV